MFSGEPVAILAMFSLPSSFHNIIGLVPTVLAVPEDLTSVADEPVQQGSRKSKIGWELTKSGCLVRSPELFKKKNIYS